MVFDEKLMDSWLQLHEQLDSHQIVCVCVYILFNHLIKPPEIIKPF